MGGVGLMAYLFYHLPYTVSMIILGVLWLLAVPIDVLRQRSPEINKVLIRWFRPIMRHHEVERLAGTTYLLTGVALVALVFPKEIVVLTLLFLALADPIASLIGIKFGRDKIFGHKSIQGALAAFIVCTVTTYLYLYTHTLLFDRILVVSVIGGAIGCLAELVPVWDIDDNFTLPVLSSIGLWLLFYFFGLYTNVGFYG